jgi:hypothetical protein
MQEGIAFIIVCVTLGKVLNHSFWFSGIENPTSSKVSQLNGGEPWL